jgi:hypothetical protein
MAPNDKDIPISRAVGRFFGHLWNAAVRPAAAEDGGTKTVRREEVASEGTIDGKPVILRRTVIEEVEFKDEPGR